MSEMSRKLNMRDRRRRRRTIWKRAVSVMAVVVVFCTVYALVLPAITLSDDPICGQQVHAHTEACYRNRIVVPDCAAAAHIHDETCADSLGNPACGFGERVLHSHTAVCYDESGVLICQLPELQEHIHSEACRKTEQSLICDLEERPEHEHSDECYKRIMICTLEEINGHTHIDSCYEQTEELVCTQQGHTHDPDCYETVTDVICQQEQVAEHVHTPSCFDEEGERICGLISGVVHVHDDTCFKLVDLDEPELICSIPEHTHVDACYLDAEDLPPVQKDFYCNMGEHEHGADCYDGAGTLICTIPVHTHDVSCKVPAYDPEADVETPEDWEKAFEDISLTGRCLEDLLTVAATQLGYRESKQNVLWHEDGSVKGYTRYGAWYGAPYIDWSAAFVSFCVNYAQLDGLPRDSSCESYRTKLEKADLWREPMNYLPKPGDLVLLDTDAEDGQTKADRMGIVSELMFNDAGELTTLKVLVGDADGEVKYLTFDLLSNMILGYGEIPDTQSKVLLCEQDHEHTDDCFGVKVYYSDDIMYAQVLIRGIHEVPQGLSLRVDRVTAANDPAAYSSMLAALSTQMQESPYYMGDASFYRVQFLLDDQPYELPQGAKTDVTVSFTEPVFTPEAMEGAAKVETYQLTMIETVNPLSETALSEISLSDSGLGDIDQTGASQTQPEGLPQQIYQVEQVQEDTYENASDGLTGIGFESDTITTFAVVLSNTTKNGQFWERVFSADEITSGGTYMIVSAEGNFALRGNNSSNYTAVSIQAQKGEEYPDAPYDENPERNTRYYTIVTKAGGAVDNTLYWTITKNGSSYTARNQGTSQYLYPYLSNSWWNSQNYVISGNSVNLSFTYETPENGWRIANGNYYLRNAGTGAFNATNSNDGTYNSSNPYYYTRDMLLFKLSDKTSLTIPDDVVNGSDSSGDGTTGPAKPDYGAFIVPTDGLEGQTAVIEGDVTVKGQYYSDPSTSNIETQFRQDSYEDSKIIDGKVVTDKSVIYGADDYDAFDHYDPNTFSVALSALGQEYEIPFEHQVRTPVDVVFVLDVSGSMSSNGDSTGTSTGQKADRVMWLCEAVNASIKQIMEDHEANRVGISIYSGGAWEMLPLDRYTATNGEYLVTNRKSFKHGPTGITFDINHLLGGSTLKNEAGKSFANVGSDAVQGIGTYTQAGIAMGNEIFEAIGDDTTYTTTIGEGDYQRTYTVKRQPVYILLSDGEPTYSTNIYNDVLNGPHYGNGGSNASTNGKGIHGYYTVLSANYYKRAVSIQYQKQAMFYSIGMGIQESTDIPDVANYQTGDNYKRAVLNPDPEVIAELTTTIAKANTTDQLKGMLLNSYTAQTVEVSAAWPEEWYGIPHVQEPVLQPNPYTDDYDYADGAYFGTLPAEELAKVFSDIYESSMQYTTYGFVLYKNSSVDILDRIGEGMEIKGTPVLRYAGVNHKDPKIIQDGNVTTYVYEGIYTDPYIPDREADLSHISVTVTTNADGTQTVEMYIMDAALPTYTPELVGRQYYYEQLPVRLIYQVGLTEEAQAQVLALNQTGGELVYYTNQWQDEDGNEDQDRISTSVLLPSTQNPFYYHIDGTEPPYKPHHSLKSEDITHTVDYHVDCHREIEEKDGEVLVKVIHKQGNNGKLVFKADTVNIPVEKQWGSGINADIMNPVEMVFYKVTDTVNSFGEVIRNAEPFTVLSLSAENGWRNTAQGLPATDGTWYYAVAETVPAGYTAYYDRETIRITTDGSTFFDAVRFDGTATAVIVTNTPAAQLPATGGVGTLWYTLGGLLLIAASLLLYNAQRKRRREDQFSL